ncbi:uncharacterized protein AB675_477 [Cyphellophora attinorum]|uniref:Small ribosomal subunit protein mS41 n=1 Tax=Cyphellophora attinorum TaxID=1664694 RepID=A0A0N1I1U5_9EURO|nr:uncharacterized protein AB675_477 [Phialophora attinorum]KPI45945.1 hypothetical protein AB675_477 [Phialophora attinorum]
MANLRDFELCQASRTQFEAHSNQAQGVNFSSVVPLAVGSTTLEDGSLIPRRAISSRNPFVCASCLSRTSIRYQSIDPSPVVPRKFQFDAPPSTKGIIPAPTPWVPDVLTFLKLIGREMSQHASKFASWDEMFTLTSSQLKAKGLEQARARKYFLRWREKFQRNEWGIGGDFTHVKDGVAELRVCEVPEIPRPAVEPKPGADSATSPPRIAASTTKTPGLTRLILNVPAGAATYVLGEGQKPTDLRKPAGFKLKEGHIITGRYTKPLAGTNGAAVTVTLTEGMWEDKRGVKKFGGERRRAETLFKMRVAERKKTNR